MDFSQLGLFSGLIGKMDWLTQRQNVLAENIANVDTPGYEAKDIAPFSFKNMLTKLATTTTQPGHIALTGGNQAKEASTLRNAYEVKPDGNAVSSEAEITKAANTAADYQLAANIYKKTISMLKMAISSNAGGEG